MLDDEINAIYDIFNILSSSHILNSYINTNIFFYESNIMSLLVSLALLWYESKNNHKHNRFYLIVQIIKLYIIIVHKYYMKVKRLVTIIKILYLNLN